MQLSGHPRRDAAVPGPGACACVPGGDFASPTFTCWKLTFNMTVSGAGASGSVWLTRVEPPRWAQCLYERDPTGPPPRFSRWGHRERLPSVDRGAGPHQTRKLSAPRSCTLSLQSHRAIYAARSGACCGCLSLRGRRKGLCRCDYDLEMETLSRIPWVGPADARRSLSQESRTARGRKRTRQKPRLRFWVRAWRRGPSRAADVAGSRTLSGKRTVPCSLQAESARPPPWFEPTETRFRTLTSRAAGQ